MRTSEVIPSDNCHGLPQIKVAQSTSSACLNDDIKNERPSSPVSRFANCAVRSLSTLFVISFVFRRFFFSFVSPARFSLYSAFGHFFHLLLVRFSFFSQRPSKVANSLRKISSGPMRIPFSHLWMKVSPSTISWDAARREIEAFPFDLMDINIFELRN